MPHPKSTRLDHALRLNGMTPSHHRACGMQLNGTGSALASPFDMVHLCFPHRATSNDPSTSSTVVQNRRNRNGDSKARVRLTFRKNFSSSFMALNEVERVDSHSSWEETCLVTTIVKEDVFVWW